jgi:hypothetical protein
MTQDEINEASINFWSSRLLDTLQDLQKDNNIVERIDYLNKSAAFYQHNIDEVFSRRIKNASTSGEVTQIENEFSDLIMKMSRSLIR